MSNPETTISTSEAEYRQLANALPQIVWTCDAEGRLAWVNERWSALTGLGQEESLRDKRALDAVHPDDREEVQRTFAQALATSTACEMEYRIRSTTGTYRFHLCRVVPIRDNAGVITRWVAAAFDIQDRHDAEAALRASERRFETVFYLNPRPSTISRFADGAFLAVNDAFLRLSGYSREEIVGRTSIALGVWSEDQRTATLARLRTDPTADFEMTCRTKDGRAVPLAVASARIDFGGEPCLLSVATDVSERLAADAALRQSAEEARARADELAALMEAVPAAVLIAQDPDCREVYANATGYALLRTLPGTNLSRTAPDRSATRRFGILENGVETRREDFPLRRAAHGVEIRNHESEIRFEDGQVMHLYGGFVPLRDPSGAPRGAIGALVDVTRLKQAEAAMLEADRRKDEFLALLAHELRNPLAPIVTAAELMQLQGDVATPYEREVILRQAKHVVRLVDDLLDVSRVARGKITLATKPLDLADLVMKAVETAGPLFEQCQHQLHLSVPASSLFVAADEVRLTQVVSNLLTNAARYTPCGGRVEVSAAREDEEIVLRVRDNGVGIEPSLLPHVFEMFVQGKRGPDRSEGGLGLGLSLVRTFTALHGGSVSAHSSGPGEGAEFVVRLPASTPQPEVADTAMPSAEWRLAGSPARRVLVVDDNRDGAEMIAHILRAVGHDVQVATDASRALLLADPFRPEIAILDIGLPVMDGYTLARELRDRLADATPFLIALTGYGSDQDGDRCRAAGFASHLVKPVNGAMLVRTIDEFGDAP